MEYTKGEWKVYESPFAPAVIIKEKPNRPDRIIAICRLERGSEGMAEATANANFIASAVNACQAINPDNPIAVTEASKDMYAAISLVLNETPGKPLGNDIKDVLRKAKAKAEGK